jgi:hypothetical protein
VEQDVEDGRVETYVPTAAEEFYFGEFGHGRGEVARHRGVKPLLHFGT